MRLETRSQTVLTPTPLNQPFYFVPFPFLGHVDFYVVLMISAYFVLFFLFPRNIIINLLFSRAEDSLYNCLVWGLHCQKYFIKNHFT